MSIRTLRELKTVTRGSPIRRRIRIAVFPYQNELFIVVTDELLSLVIALIIRLRRSLIIDVCLTLWIWITVFPHRNEIFVIVKDFLSLILLHLINRLR